MTTEYSISVDDWADEKWAMTGRDVMLSVLEDKNTKQHKELKQEAKSCGCSVETLIYERADEQVPMMLYAYPLDSCPSDEKIVRICEETNCTVVEDNQTGGFFLALTGGGMDLSQDIAMAYIIAQGHIPAALAANVSTQEGLSQYGKNWLKVMRYCKNSLLDNAMYYKNCAKTISEAVKEFHAKEVDGYEG